jgi:hypothetical protein
MNKMKNTRKLNQKLIGLVLIVTIGLGILIALGENKNFNNIQNRFLAWLTIKAPPFGEYLSARLISNCDNPNLFKYILNYQFDGDFKFKSLNSTQDYLGLIIWKRSGKEPFVSYPVTWTMTITHEGNEIGLVRKKYEETLDNQLAWLGFHKSYLSTYSRYFSETEGDIGYGYQKNNSLINVSIKNTYSRNGQENVELTFYCGNKEIHYDALYDELLATEVASQVMGDEWVKHINRENFFIHDIQGNTVFVGLSSMDGFGGYDVWFHKENNGWIKIYEGNGSPDCSLEQKYQIKIGFPCDKK